MNKQQGRILRGWVGFMVVLVTIVTLQINPDLQNNPTPDEKFVLEMVLLFLHVAGMAIWGLGVYLWDR
ncbi:MAG: hypothetical protein WCF93_02780 [Candidatus Moraniibacteriota bacterium]